MNESILNFDSDAGAPLAARLVLPGQGYGTWDTLTKSWSRVHAKEKGPVVEFYDRRTPATPHGQFLSRYHLESLSKRSSGFVLDTADEGWKITYKEMTDVVNAFEKVVALQFANESGLTRSQQARHRAREISKEFNYERLVEPHGGAGVEMWRCKKPGSFDYAHDMVISRMGICAFGDMDPLVFRVGSEYGMKFLAGNDVDNYIHGKLDATCKSVEVDPIKLAYRFCEGVRHYLKTIWNDKAPSEGPIHEAVEALRDVKPDQALHRLEEFFEAVEQPDPHWDQVSTSYPPENVREDLLDVWTDIKQQSDPQHVLAILDEANSQFFDAFSDVSGEAISAPTINLLTRLHVLNISANRILEIQKQAEVVFQPKGMRPRQGQPG